MSPRRSEYRPGQLRVKAKPRRTRRYAALTRSFNPGRVSHYPGMSMEEQKQRPGLSVFIVKVCVSRVATAAKQAALNPRSCPQMRSA
jgi:hypothetical protein